MEDEEKEIVYGAINWSIAADDGEDLQSLGNESLSRSLPPSQSNGIGSISPPREPISTISDAELRSFLLY